jgi:type IV secretory pathway TrbL component
MKSRIAGFFLSLLLYPTLAAALALLLLGLALTLLYLPFFFALRCCGLCTGGDHSVFDPIVYSAAAVGRIVNACCTAGGGARGRRGQSLQRFAARSTNMREWRSSRRRAEIDGNGGSAAPLDAGLRGGQAGGGYDTAGKGLTVATRGAVGTAPLLAVGTQHSGL